MKVYYGRNQFLSATKDGPMMDGEGVELVLKSDADKLLAAKDLEIRILREQRDDYIKPLPGHLTMINILDNQIATALEKMEK